VLVRRIEQHGVAGLGAAQHVHVVVHRTHDDLVDLEAGVRGEEGVVHPPDATPNLVICPPGLLAGSGSGP